MFKRLVKKIEDEEKQYEKLVQEGKEHSFDLIDLDEDILSEETKLSFGGRLADAWWKGLTKKEKMKICSKSGKWNVG